MSSTSAEAGPALTSASASETAARIRMQKPFLETPRRDPTGAPRRGQNSRAFSSAVVTGARQQKTRSTKELRSPAPVGPNGARHAGEGAVAELGTQEALGVHRPGHGHRALGDASEAQFAVIGIVAHQHHEPVPAGARRVERALDQRT